MYSVKNLTRSTRRKAKMKQAAEVSGKVLMVMRNNRFRMASQFIKTYVEKEHMGEIYAGRVPACMNRLC
jgi:predicted dehydrogenase